MVDQANRPKGAIFSNNFNEHGPLLGLPFGTRFSKRIRGHARTTTGGQKLHEETFMTCSFLGGEKTVKTCTETVVETRSGSGVFFVRKFGLLAGEWREWRIGDIVLVQKFKLPTRE